MATNSRVNRGNLAFLPSKHLSALQSACRHLEQTVGRWRSRNRWRGDLAQLLQTDPRLIADIGLDPIEVRREINKPFWRF